MPQIADISKALKALFWPQRCMFCSELIFDSPRLTCKRCEKSIPFVTGKICKMCGCEKSLCSCSGRVMYYDSVAAPFYYEGGAKKCITAFKFRSKKLYAGAIAEYLYDELATFYKDERFDFIACVPLHKKDKRRRGFNQSEMIAKCLSDKTGIPFRPDLITKLYRTDSQASQHMINRSGNVFGAYGVKEGEDLTSCSVLLIDDIKTTGSTLSECGKMLYLAGAQRVCCLCFCVSKLRKKEKEKGR